MFTIWALYSSLALACLDSGAADQAREPISAPESASSSALESSASEFVQPSELSAARPDWLGAAPQSEGGVYYVTVDSGPFATEGEAFAGLDAQLEASAQNHVNEFLGYAAAARYFDLSPERLHTELVHSSDLFTETRQYSFGEMHHAYARLTFDAGFHDQLRHQWRELQSWFRLARFGALGLLGTAFLATLFMWLRLDTFTRGLHTFGLRFGAAITILALAAAGFLAVQRIPSL